MIRKNQIEKEATIESVNLFLNPNICDEKLAHTYSDGFKHGAEWADSHPNWHLCKDELPEESGENCIFYTRLGRYQVGTYDNEYEVIVMGKSLGFKPVFIDSCNDPYSINEVIAWIELPKFKTT